MLRPEPSETGTYKTEQQCPTCKEGEIVAVVYKQYSGIMGATTAPRIFIGFRCEKCKNEYSFPPGKASLMFEFLDRAEKEDAEERHKEWMEKAGLIGPQEPVVMHEVNLKPGEYLGLDGKAHRNEQ